MNMKHFKVSILLLMSVLVVSVCRATEGASVCYYTQAQIDSIVNLKVQRYLDTTLIELKIDKIANEKFDSFQSKHDVLITQHLTLLGALFTILAAVIGIVIPLVMNRRVENKMDENAKVMDSYNNRLMDSRLELEKGKQNLSNIEDKVKEVHEQMKQLKQETQYSMKKAEQAARKSQFSELLSKAWNEKDFGKKIELVTMLIDEYPDDDFASKSYFTRGGFYYENKSFDKAVADYTEAIKRNSDDAALFCSRGDAYCKLSQWNNAIEDYSKAIEMNPKYAEAYYGRGSSLIQEDRPKAIEDLQKAISISPDFLKAYYVLGGVYEAGENYDKALDILEEGNRKAKIMSDLKWGSRIRKELEFVNKKKMEMKKIEYQTESDRLFSRAVDQLTKK